MQNTITPHYAQELRRVRRKKSLTQLKWVVLGMTCFIVVPVAVLVILGYLGL